MHAILEIRNITNSERPIVEALLRRPGDVSQVELIGLMRDPPSQATVSRLMSSLIDKGLVIKEGQTRGARFRLSDDARRVATDPRRRPSTPYDPDRISGYLPNVSRWLPEAAATRMRRAVEDAGGQRLDASTYGKAIAERFLIDLSWASSHLEGNTYDHLSTELLIKYGESASGRDRTETAMILNHKAAISDMIEGLDHDFSDVQTVQRRHVLMMRDLMDPADIGAIRRNAVQISASNYAPSTDPAVLSSSLGDLLFRAKQVEDPYEASLLLLAGTSYLQIFGDGNKRMGRLLCNEPLLRAGLPPLSFVGIDKTPYILGLIEFYETGRTSLLGDVIADAYELTAADYLRSFSVQRVPHSLKLRERARISDIVGRVFRDDVPAEGLRELVDETFQDLDAAERDTLEAIVTEIVKTASPASAVLFGVTEADIERRRGWDEDGSMADGPP